MMNVCQAVHDYESPINGMIRSLRMNPIRGAGAKKSKIYGCDIRASKDMPVE
jgi:hypothetical protein